MLLPTRGIDPTEKYKILERHLYSFLRHLTAKKAANFFRAEHARITRKSVLKSYPYLLKIEPANICNLHCAYCYDGRRQPTENERPYGRMTFQNFKKIVDEVGQFLFKINLYGFGEPFLFPETLEMISYAARSNIGVATSSNMNFKDPGLPGAIVESGLEVLIFSCHGVSDETYKKFMGKGDPALAMGNIAKVIEEKARRKSRTPLIDWQFCVTGFNQHEIGKAREKARKLGIDQVRFIKPLFPDNVDDSSWVADSFSRQADDSRRMSSSDCVWLYRAAYINFDGGLIPCCRDTRDLRNDFGNVFSERFSDIWNGEQYRAARRLLANPWDREARQADTMCSRCPITRPPAKKP